MAEVRGDLAAGSALTASVRPPVRTIQPASRARLRAPSTLAASASASAVWPCTAAPVAESTMRPSTLEQAGLQGQVEPVGWDGDRPVTYAPGGGVVGDDVGQPNRKSAYRLSITPGRRHTVRTAASATRR